MVLANQACMLFVKADFLIRSQCEPYVKYTRIVRNFEHEFRAGTQKLVLVRDGHNSSDPCVRVTIDEKLLRRFRRKLRLNADETKLSVKAGKAMRVDVDVTVTRTEIPNRKCLVFKADIKEAVFKAAISHIINTLWE